MNMFDQYKSQIISHAISEYPNESCGLIIKNKGFVPCKNKHKDPLNNFKLEAKLYKDFKNVIAVIHSHPNGNLYPSENDMKQQMISKKIWGILTTDGKTCSDILWFGDKALKRNNFSDLIGRPFVHGVYDCYSLVRDYHFIINNLNIKDYPRSWDWWNNDKNLYFDLFNDCGFKIINNLKEIKIGDSFLWQIKSNVNNHSGIYLGNNLVLHHISGKK